MLSASYSVWNEKEENNSEEERRRKSQEIDWVLGRVGGQAKLTFFFVILGFTEFNYKSLLILCFHLMW